MKTIPKVYYPRWTPKAAITLPPIGIFIKQKHKQSQRIFYHEWCHWHQARELGAIKFYLKYLWLFIRHGYYYHPMEMEARIYANRIVDRRWGDNRTL